MKPTDVNRKLIAALVAITAFGSAWWFVATDSCSDLGGTVDTAAFRCVFDQGGGTLLLAALSPVLTLILVCVFGLLPYFVVDRSLRRLGHDV